MIISTIVPALAWLGVGKSNDLGEVPDKHAYVYNGATGSFSLHLHSTFIIAIIIK